MWYWELLYLTKLKSIVINQSANSKKNHFKEFAKFSSIMHLQDTEKTKHQNNWAEIGAKKTLECYDNALSKVFIKLFIYFAN